MLGRVCGVCVWGVRGMVVGEECVCCRRFGLRGVSGGLCVFFFQAEGGIRGAQESGGLGDVCKGQVCVCVCVCVRVCVE